MRKILLICLIFLSGYSIFAQVSKTNSTPLTVSSGPASGSETFTYLSGDFGGCTSLTEVEISITLDMGSGAFDCDAAGDPYSVQEDLALRLESPSGTIVDLVFDKWDYFEASLGNTLSSFITVTTHAVLFDDDAASVISGDWSSWTTAKPVEPLSAFDGENAAGTWTLYMADGHTQFSTSDYFCISTATLTVTCGVACTDPDVPTVTYTPLTVCNGNNATLNIAGTLNDATAWHIYTGSCGGTQIGTTATSSFVVSPSFPSTTYYVRGEGGCVTPGSCGSVTVTVTALDDASFSYGSLSYCVNDADPTPTISGLAGGTFSAGAGLSLNASTGQIDVSASVPNTYTLTYTTSGACPNSSDVNVTINGLDNASFSYSAASYSASDSDPTPTITGLAGGTFTSTPSGLSLNASTGQIDVSASTPTAYTVTYTTSGACPANSNESVTIVAMADTIYINSNRPDDTGDGLSWATAKKDLQSGIALANSGDVVWVATGTYYPTTGTDRSISFVMKDGVAIYGGFDGTESLLSERDWVTNVTILSADIGIQNDISDNCYHVIYNFVNGLTSTAVLDGFIISDGNANGNTPNSSIGGGMVNAQSSPTLANCIFSGNSADYGGGGMWNQDSSTPTLTNCSFSGNLTSEYGGGMSNLDLSSSMLTNCSFSGNSATSGGGMYNQSASMLTNCSFSGNSANFGGGMFNQTSSSPMLTNCIFWGNTTEITGDPATVVYSIVQGGYTGTGNLDVDPLFIIQPDYTIAPTTTGDLHLQPCSPAIDAGTNTGAPSDDLDGNVRPYNSGIVDMGAYEYQGSGTTITNGIVYVNANVSGGNDDGSSWTNAFTYLQDALALANSCSNVSEIWVATGLYYPDEGTGQTNNDQTASFNLIEGVKLYGGFVGTETLLSQRDWDANVTILSGDIDGDDTNTDGNYIAETYTDIMGSNSYHVLVADGTGTANITGTTELNGFYVTAGKAWLTSNYNDIGAGLFCKGFGSGNESSPSIVNCHFSGNNALNPGGAINNYGYNGTSSPNLTNCSFLGNSSNASGGAINNYGSNGTSSPNLTNCSFFGNSSGNNGGAIQNYGYNGTSNPIFTNCSFSGNSSSDDGGAIQNRAIGSGTSSPILSYSL